MVKTYEAVAKAFIAEGVDTVFALVGDANLQWSVAMDEFGASVIGVRNEAGAVAAADGFAQTGGGVGVASVTCGPGLVETGAALGNAARSGVPIVLYAGDTPAASPGNTQDMDQRRFIEAMGAEFVQLRNAATALEDVRLAFYRARSHNRAVVLNAPMDVQAAEHPGDWSYSATSVAPAPTKPVAAPEAVEQILDLIAASARPVVVAGRGAMGSGDPSALLALAERAGALTATTMVAKGWLADDDFAVGVIGPNSSSVADELFETADLVLAFGSTLDRFALLGRTPVFPKATIVSVNIEPAARGQNQPVDLYVTGDATAVAQQLAAGIEERALAKNGFRTQEVRQRLIAAEPVRIHSEPGHMDPREVMQVLESHLPARESRVVVGSGHFFSWPIMHLHRPRGGNFLFTHYFGSIGLTLATGMGVAVANPEQTVVVIEGDGSMMTSLPELETVARLGLRLLVVVLNDEAFGAEFYKAKTFGVNEAMTHIPTPRFDDVARALGGDGAMVTDGESLDKALEDFDARGGLYVVDARVDGEIMCDMYRKLHFGLPNVAPHQRALSSQEIEQ